MIRAAIIAGVAAALMFIAFFGGHQSGQAKERSHWMEIENATLREQSREITRQAQLVTDKQKAYNRAQTQIATSDRRYRDTDRLRQKSERERAIAAASAETCRVYAHRVTELFETCRSEYISMGHEAERSRSAVEALR